MTSERSQELPWGRYTALGGGDGYQVKEILVQPGRRLSYQRHGRRSEHWLVVGGSGQVVLDGREWTLPSSSPWCVRARC